MKKRIDTLMYDTETAKKLGEWSNNLPKTEFEHCSETLYKKRTGEYFLYGKGGALSKYSKHPYGQKNDYVGGEDIIPLTRDEAQRWFEKANNDDPDLAPDKVYNREFSKAQKDEVKEATSINLSRTAKRKLEQMALKQGTSQSKIVENLILSK